MTTVRQLLEALGYFKEGNDWDASIRQALQELIDLRGKQHVEMEAQEKLYQAIRKADNE